jgi:hypothetical protein
MKKKVKILKTSYKEEDNVVVWEVEFEDGKIMSLVNKADELIRNVLQRPSLVVTKEMILEFNKNIIGTNKIMDFVAISNSIKDIDKDKIEDFKSCLDEFPILEAKKIAKEKK